MNRHRIAIVLGTLGALGVLVAVNLAQATERTVTLKVAQMTCATCPYTVRKALERVKGVKNASVSFEEKTAVVTFDDAQATLQALTEATTRAGYPSSLLQTGPAQ